ncbi:hypothetical protein ASF99_13575 [Exiguobacterium sp. Leaf187]|uniref:hypothetical protein n=1 Tax=Exiguobacterium TaxID=33986 RepID=UPI0006FA3E78|nr:MULTISPECIES: hypothetical protein [Exiguobacterium]KQS23530.1 hypothetical protein ASF99_13575 [Exiguobacterium sp. Leaf187]
MAQSIFGGSSEYSDQTLADIIEDLEKWVVFSEETLSLFDKTICELKQNNYYQTVPFNLRAMYERATRKLNTFISDLNVIIKSINADSIFIRDVNLLNNIGRISILSNHQFGTVYHDIVDRWSGANFQDSNFLMIERLYHEGRDVFVSLMDASNAAERLKDYMSDRHQQNQNITVYGSDNHIQAAFGSNNEFIMNVNKTIEKESAIQLDCLLTELLQKTELFYGEDQRNEKQEVSELVEGIREEMMKSEPKKGRIRSYLVSLKASSTLTGYADFITIVTGISELVYSLPFMK